MVSEGKIFWDLAPSHLPNLDTLTKMLRMSHQVHSVDHGCSAYLRCPLSARLVLNQRRWVARANHVAVGTCREKIHGHFITASVAEIKARLFYDSSESLERQRGERHDLETSKFKADEQRHGGRGQGF